MHDDNRLYNLDINMYFQTSVSELKVYKITSTDSIADLDKRLKALVVSCYAGIKRSRVLYVM